MTTVRRVELTTVARIAGGIDDSRQFCELAVNADNLRRPPGRYVREMVESHDVVIVGAGLAGLAAARVLSGAGREVVVLEAGDAPGGRVRTDEVDGMLLDRGFQLINPSYPQAGRTFDLRALQLRTFGAGAVIAHGARR